MSLIKRRCGEKVRKEDIGSGLTFGIIEVKINQMQRIANVVPDQLCDNNSLNLYSYLTILCFFFRYISYLV